jgi:hypothetical protein
MGKLQIKKLIYHNWLKRDKSMSGFGIIKPDDSYRDKTSSEWFADIYKIKLSNKVPDEIHDLFEVTRGTMTYGFFYYPIYTVSVEQFSRILEAAISLKCQSLNMPASKKTLEKKIDWLSGILEFTDDELSRLTSLRELRNSWSHSKRQNLTMPGQAISFMNITAKVINQLF